MSYEANNYNYLNIFFIKIFLKIRSTTITGGGEFSNSL